jgi:hypothetical protein
MDLAGDVELGEPGLDLLRGFEVGLAADENGDLHAPDRITGFF